MFEICCGGELVALTTKPRYVKRNETSGLFIEATQDEAEAISVNGTLYNIPGGTAIEGALEATVREADASEYIFGNRVSIERNAETGTAKINSIEDAVCELDEVTGQRMSAIEDAICELDEAINRGGEQ